MLDALEVELKAAKALALEAGRILLSIYAKDFSVAYKGTNNPVTEADQQVNTFLVRELRQRFPEDGIVAEETDDQSEAQHKRRCWFVDPLDGTKEFIAKNGEFSVMIGLAVDGASQLGVVYQPSLDKLYAGVVGRGATLTQQGSERALRVSEQSDPRELRLVVSRSHRPESIEQIMQRLGASREMPSGSVGVKVGLIAEQSADLYVHVSDKSSLWDACGPEAILKAAGGRFSHVDGSQVNYRAREMANQKGILACNSASYAPVLEAVRDVSRSIGFIQ
ncbi:MAG: 3'(2'),5'-bisphosphate nucleotidase CysQ [Myxococcales bacterium]